jgi:hypothetical protein
MVCTGRLSTRLQAGVVIFLFAAFSSSTVEATPVHLDEAGFEEESVPDGSTWSDFWDWDSYGTAGVLNPSSDHYPGGAAPEGENVAFLSKAELWQDVRVGLEANTTYIVRVDVGQRLDVGFGGYRVELWDSGHQQVLATDANTLQPAPGAFETSTITYTALPGDPELGSWTEITLVSLGPEVNFDNVRIDAVPYPPVVFAEGDILVATITNRDEIYRVDPATGDQTFVSGFAEGLRHIAVDARGDVWASVESEGVVRLDGRTGVQDIVASGGLMDGPFGIAIDAKGDILVADSREILRVDPVSGSQSVVSSGGLLAAPFGLAIDDDGYIYFGTAISLVRVHPKTGKQKTIVNHGPQMGIAVERSGDLVATNPQSDKVIRVKHHAGSDTWEEELITSGGLIVNPNAIAVAANGDLLVTSLLDGSEGAVVRVNPVTGEQAVVSRGPSLSGGVGIASFLPSTSRKQGEVTVKIQLKFNKPSKDKIQVKIKDWQLPANVVPTAVTVNVGGASFTGTLDAKGKYKSADGRDSILMKQRKKTQLWSITVKRKKNDFAADLADEGLTNADNPKPGLSVTVPLTIEVGGAAYSWDVDLVYKSKLGKKGIAK